MGTPLGPEYILYRCLDPFGCFWHCKCLELLNIAAPSPCSLSLPKPECRPDSLNHKNIEVEVWMTRNGVPTQWLHDDYTVYFRSLSTYYSDPYTLTVTAPVCSRLTLRRSTGGRDLADGGADLRNCWLPD